MVVDHHDVRGKRIAARAHYEAVGVIGAPLAEAVVARRGGLRPDRRVFRHLREVGAVARDGGGGEALDVLQLRRFLARCCASLGYRAAQPIQADVIRAALEERRARAAGERRAHRRQIAVEKLVL